MTTLPDDGLEPPAWYHDDITLDDDWEPDVDELEQVRVEAAEADAERALRDLAHFTGPIPREGRSAAETLRDEVGEHRARRLADAGFPDLDDFLNQPEPEYDWLVPGLLERGDRLILTAEEGRGKSTLLRQTGVQIAAGIHPFTLDKITPARVLLLDLENPPRLVRRALRPLRISAGSRLTRGFFTPVVWPEGLDLRVREDQRRLTELIELVTPDLLITGPSYKLASGDPTSEEHAKLVTSILDQLRARHGFALLLEAHQPYAATPGSKRAIRPYGASLWSRWPEFGLHLAEDGAIQHFRPGRDERDWPKALHRGGNWPWTPVSDARGVTFARILEELRDAGYELGRRELADRIGGHHTTITRAIEANREQYDRVVAQLGPSE